jgi:hypothetical protein
MSDLTEKILNSEALKVKSIETLIQIVAALLVDAELSCDDVWWRVQGCDDLCKKISRQNRCLSTLFPTSSLHGLSAHINHGTKWQEKPG